jgi:hypothetical protein
MILEHIHTGSSERTYEAIQQIVSILLKDERMKQFISWNRGDVFTTRETNPEGVLDYSVSKTIARIKRDLYAEYKQTHRSSRSRSVPRGAHFKMLFPFICMQKNWNIPHYFILYYEDGKWYIYSSYSSEYVRIGIAKIEISLHVFMDFMHCMYKQPRTPEENEFMEEFFRMYFLADPTQQIVCVEDAKGDNRTYMPDKEKGVRKEIDLYRSTSIMLVYVPEFKAYVRQLIQENADQIQTILDPVGLSLKSSVYRPTLINISSAASAIGAAEEPDHTMRGSGP